MSFDNRSEPSVTFPGRDPYLEDPRIWPGVHSRMVVYLADHLQPQLRPRYIAAVEERAYVEGPDHEVIPDAWIRQDRTEEHAATAAVVDADSPVVVRVPAIEVRESYVMILDRLSDQSVVTVIELVSPANKAAGPGRVSYVTKQREVLASPTHLVEIDLLRAGQHVLSVSERVARSHAYADLACVNRAARLRDLYDLYPRGLRDRLPRIRIPLADGDPDVVLDLQVVLAQTYEAGSYRDRLDYRTACTPPMSPEDQAWAAVL